MTHELVFDADEVGVNQVVGNIRKAREDLAFIPEYGSKESFEECLANDYHLPRRVSHIIAHADKAPAVRAQAVAFVDDMLRLGVGSLALCTQTKYKSKRFKHIRYVVTDLTPRDLVSWPAPPPQARASQFHLGVKFLFSPNPRKPNRSLEAKRPLLLGVGFSCYANEDSDEPYRLVEDPTVPRDHEVMSFAPGDDWERHYALLRELWTEKKRAQFTYQDRRQNGGT